MNIPKINRQMYSNQNLPVNTTSFSIRLITAKYIFLLDEGEAQAMQCVRFSKGGERFLFRSASQILFR